MGLLDPLNAQTRRNEKFRVRWRGDAKRHGGLLTLLSICFSNLRRESGLNLSMDSDSPPPRKVEASRCWGNMQFKAPIIFFACLSSEERSREIKNNTNIIYIDLVWIKG